ncbi:MULTISPECIES: fimbrial biogenesis chaperone [Pseudomonas]|uniref:fimbrial biogenesis chaperone n=1 Tax=Pseudomonas TaxID=286 RepID=UPI001E63F2DF|nr:MULTISPECIES: molecular chaperone [Pseudomonas]MCD5982441.1 molecular chaperone [Pseudomonas sp. CDFA 610]MCQ9469876.1 molecular chaperone [Pseudomonas alliivorans]
MRRGYRLMLLALLSVTSVCVQGALSLTGTRLIFDGRYREVSLEVRNSGQDEVLVQAWLSDPLDDEMSASPQILPFVVTPPLSRISAGGRQALRVLYQGTGMPEDRESLLHLSVLEIPRREPGNRQLTIAVRQRINVFYRPDGLPGDPAESAERLSWTMTDNGSGMTQLQVSNPTAYHASLESLNLDGVEISDHLLLAPGARIELPVSMHVLPRSGLHRLAFKALTDYGGQRAYCTNLSGQASSSARLLENLTLQEAC